MKTYVITWKSIVFERWIVEAETKAEAKENFRSGQAQLSERSEIDLGAIHSVRVANAIDIENAAATAGCASWES